MVKTHKHLKKKMSKSRKLKKGGTLFEINYDQLKNLVHIGKQHEPGDMVSCGACAMNKLGFPEDLVNMVSTEANSHGYGLRFTDALTVINKLQDRIKPGEKPASIYVWAFTSGFYDRLIVKRSTTASLESGQRKMTNLQETMDALKGIIETMVPGSGALLGIIWGIGDLGHYVVIAKSNRDTPYIIETQHGGYEGVYRGWNQVKNYFQRNHQVAYFMTYNNSEPQFNNQDKQWEQLDDDPLLPINRTSLRLARYIGSPYDKRLIHADKNRSTKPPKLTRSKSFMPIDESYTVEDSDEEDEQPTPATSMFGQPSAPATSIFGQPSAPATSIFGQPTAPATPKFGQPSAPATSIFGQPSAPATSMFGQPTAPATPKFGQPSAPATSMFGQPSAPATSMFGQPSAPATSMFGQPTTFESRRDRRTFGRRGGRKSKKKKNSKMRHKSKKKKSRKINKK